MTRTDPSVPEDTGSGVECGYCGRRFVDREVLALHRGQEHPERLGSDEREAFETARAAETAALRRFRLKALAALVFIYFGFLFAYSVFA